MTPRQQLRSPCFSAGSSQGAVMTVSAGQNSARPAVAPALLDRSIQALKLGLLASRSLSRAWACPSLASALFPASAARFRPW